MNSAEIVTLIKEHLIQTIEEMGFVFLYEGVETVEQSAPGSICVAIDVDGGIKGTIGLICSENLGLTIAQNILCLDPESMNVELIKDSIAEILNTVAGRVMENVSKEINYSISIPSFQCSTQGEGTYLINMSADEGNITVILKF
jgi:CheY-specific phosphatase CheX